MTATVPDVETIEHLDFTPACQSTECKAGHPPATHAGRGIVCGCMVLYCTDCASRVRRILDWIGNWFCAPCGAHVGLGRGFHFFWIEPLP